MEYCDLGSLFHGAVPSINAMTHLVSALAVYTIQPLKLSAIKLIAKTRN
jgi:hypothetical protein